MKKLIIPTVVLLALTGCSSTSSELGPVDNVEQLRDAYTDAGYECDWKPREGSDFTEGFGECSYNTVLMHFVDESHRDSMIERNRMTFEGTGVEFNYLVGPNWVIGSPDVDALQNEFGGEVVKF